MEQVFARQRAAQMADGTPSLKLRQDRLDRAIVLLADHADRIAQALEADYGHRSRTTTLLAEVVGTFSPLEHARKHVERWMRKETHLPTPALLRLAGARCEVRYQPKGVVGNLVPFNFPVSLSFIPLAGMLAAGNRVMIKHSEATPHTASLLAELFSSAFDLEEVAVVQGGLAASKQFAALPFDHLLFTGSPATGSRIMAAAAENLTPVTLELGGKNPAIVGRTADLELTARRLLFGKTLNAGQVCLSSDYVLVPSEIEERFIECVRSTAISMFPRIADNPDYTAIINEGHFERLCRSIADAVEKGARAIEINPANEQLAPEDRKIAFTLLSGVSDKAEIMQREIFGPVLPIVPYRKFSQAIDFINGRPRPLAAYYFGTDDAEREALLDRTTSGTVAVNEVIFQAGQENLPFGGVGPSGMGAYHGIHGFREFSHAKSIYFQMKKDPAAMAMFRPPFTKKVEDHIDKSISRASSAARRRLKNNP